MSKSLIFQSIQIIIYFCESINSINLLEEMTPTEPDFNWQNKIIPIPKNLPKPNYPDPLDIFNAAASEISNINTKVTDDPEGFEKEPETWVEPVAVFIWNFLLDYGLSIGIFLAAYSLFVMIFKKIYLTGIVSSWKYFLGYNPTLEMMAELLEADYELELWSEPEFCKKFIELFESFRRLRSFANRDHLGNSLIDDRKRQEEAKPLYQFFDVDYELHPRLLYALQGTEWTGWEEQEVEVEVVEGEQADDELLQGNEMMMGADEQLQQKESEADQNQLQQRIKKE